MAIFPGLCPAVTGRAPADDRQGSRRSPADVEKSVAHRQVIWRPPAGDRAVIVSLPAKYGRRYKKSVTLLAPVIPAVVTMMRRREFEAHLAHFNILMGVAAIVMGYEEEEERQRHRRAARRRWWVRPWLARRPIYGHYERLMNELLRENHTDFKMFLRLEPEMFFELVERVEPRIQKNTR